MSVIQSLFFDSPPFLSEIVISVMVYTKVSTGGATSSSVAADIGRGRAVCGMLCEGNKKAADRPPFKLVLGRKKGQVA